MRGALLATAVACGIAIVPGDISHTCFKDSFAFTIVPTLIGLGIVAAVWWQRHEARRASG